MPVSRRVLAANYPLVRLNSLPASLPSFPAPLRLVRRFDLRPFLCPENLKLNLSRTMSPVITHEIKWTKIPVTGFSFSRSPVFEKLLLFARLLSASPPTPAPTTSPCLCLSVSLEWLTCCCCCCCGQEALKMNSKTVDAGKLKTELSRLLFALFRLMSFYFLFFFFSPQFVLPARFPTLMR